MLVCCAGVGPASAALLDTKVMSFNIRIDHGIFSLFDHPWDGRKQLVYDTIDTFGPDLLGVQEAAVHQINDLRSAFPQYGFSGVGRGDGVEASEFTGLFFRNSMFDLVDEGTFWLSPTPELPGSVYPGQTQPRIASWAVLDDLREPGSRLLFLNTHWATGTDPAARNFSADLIRQRIGEILPGGPAIVIGDFNMNETSEAYRRLRGTAAGLTRVLDDSYRTLHPSVNTSLDGTFHGWDGSTTGRPIDLILHSPEVTAVDAAINHHHVGSDYPSDHYAVQATLRLPGLPITPILRSKLVADDAQADDIFGEAVALDGGVAIVGAFRSDDTHFAADTQSGSAYIFTRAGGPGGSWSQLKKLTAADAKDGDQFGFAVGVHAGHAVVGAFRSDGSNPAINSQSGSAYIFGQHHGGADQWGQVRKLTASDADDGDQFGSAVALHADHALIGAFRNDDVGTDSGSAYVFGRNHGGADQWGQVKKLTASDAASGDQFGRAVALDDGIALVGAFRTDDGGTDAGSVYVFEKDRGGADAWGQAAELHASDAQAGDYFGWSTAISGTTAIVGAYGQDDGGTDAGAAYIFTQAFGSWFEVARLTPQDADAGDRFGYAVSLDGDLALVGAPGSDAPGGADSGAAYLFGRNQGGQNRWGQIARYTAADLLAGDEFGGAVALDGVASLLGAHFADAGGSDAGAAYLFDATIPGDANLNGLVEQGDLDAVLQNWGRTNQHWTTGDFNGNGQVEQGDLDAVLQHWGQSSRPNPNPFVVPEPAAGMVLLLATGRLRRGARRP